MNERRRGPKPSGTLSRRRFFQIGGAVALGSAFPAGARIARAEGGGGESPPPATRRFRTLGRTGFEVSDVSLGCIRNSEPNVIRYAYDRGINYFDTAEAYLGGASERAIGEAMPHMDRKKIFVTTKLVVGGDDDESTLLDRFTKCQERLKTDYVDALLLHSAESIDYVGNEGFHAAAKRLRSDGRIRFVGVSSHGPRGDEGDSMEKVLLHAAADGRFDLMLFTYNFLNTEAAQKVLAACKERAIGTTAMKIQPGMLGIEPYDPENPQPDYVEYIDGAVAQGVSKEEAIERINAWARREQEKVKQMQPFLDRHGVKTNEQFREKCVQWVLANPDMHTVCVTMADFETVDRFVALSGTELSRADADYLDGWRYAFGDRYCRHGCTACMASCPARTPVSTIMRYTYYFTGQGREKYAMTRYARLGASNASPCLGCAAPCAGSCPHGVDIQPNMVRAHGLLTV